MKTASEITHVELVTWTQWLFFNSVLEEVLAEILGKDVNDKYDKAYLSNKCNKHRNNFTMFWAELDKDAQSKFVEIAIRRYNK